MKLEAGKEMDRKCVWDWLNEVYSDPSLSYCKHTDEEIRIFAHDALVLLKEQEAVEPKVIGTNSFGDPVHACGKCGILITESMNYCRECGKRIKWED